MTVIASFSIIEIIFFFEVPSKMFLFILPKNFQDTIVFFDNRTAFICSSHYLSTTSNYPCEHPPLCKMAFTLRHLF